MNNKYLLILLLTGLIIRLLLAPIPGLIFDVNDWFSWAIRLNSFPLKEFYSLTILTDYPPGTLYILKILGFLKIYFNFSNNLFYFVLKLPAIISEIGLAILIYQQVVKKYSIKAALIASSLILFNPGMIFDTSIWGQIDALLVLFLFLTVKFLNEHRLLLASILFGLALSIKPQAILLSPIFVLFLVNKPEIINFFKLIIPAVLVVFALFLPFAGVYSNPINLFLKMSQDYAYTSLFAYNFWGIGGFWVSDQIKNHLTFQVWGYIMFLVYWLIITIISFRKKMSIFLLASLASLSFYFLPTRVHERYLYPAIVFLIPIIFQIRSKFMLALILILNLTFLFNLYFVYEYYTVNYSNQPSIIYSLELFNILQTNGSFLSLISTIIFFSLSFIIPYVYLKTVDKS